MKKEQIIYELIAKNAEEEQIITLKDLEASALYLRENQEEKMFLRKINYEKESNLKHNVVMAYNFFGRYITFYEEVLENNRKELWEIYIRFPEKERYYLINSILMNYILHELEHMKQNIRSYSLENNVETYILKHSLPNCTNFNVETYERFYKINPCERLANIEATKKIYNILQSYLQKYPRVIKQYQRYLKQSIINGYYTNISPTYSFLKKTNQKNRIEKLRAYQKEMNLEARIYYGFPILSKNKKISK